MFLSKTFIFLLNTPLIVIVQRHLAELTPSRKNVIGLSIVLCKKDVNFFGNIHFNGILFVSFSN